MATSLTIPKSYADGQVITEADIDNFRDNLLTTVNTTKFDGDNLQTGSVTPVILNSSAVDDLTIQHTGAELQLKDAGLSSAKFSAREESPSDEADPGVFGVSFSGVLTTGLSNVTSWTDVPDGVTTLSLAGNSAFLLFIIPGAEFELNTLTADAQTSLRILKSNGTPETVKELQITRTVWKSTGTLKQVASASLPSAQIRIIVPLSSAPWFTGAGAYTFKLQVIESSIYTFSGISTRIGALPTTKRFTAFEVR